MKYFPSGLFHFSNQIKWKTLLFFILVFVSLGSLNAQYVGRNTAVTILKQEISVLNQQEAQTSNNSTLMTIKFKRDYFLVVMADIEKGKTVDQAIHQNMPRAKASTHPSGLMVYNNNSPGFKQEAAALVTYTEGILHE